MPTTTTGPGRRRLFVVAGSHPEYHQYLREQHLTAKEAVFLRRPEQLDGTENPQIVYAGTWESAPHLAAIQRAALERTRPTSPPQAP